MSISSFFKYTLTATLAAYFTYTYYPQINRAVNKARYFTAENEKGFVEKDQAFNLRFHFERNRRGNLETYVLYFSEKIPVYSRANGLRFGAAQSNSTSSETKSQYHKQASAKRML